MWEVNDFSFARNGLCPAVAQLLYYIATMPLSIGMNMRDVLMHVLSSLQCQNRRGDVRTCLKKKLMRSFLLPQQIFFLVFTSVYTLMAIWLNASDTACELHDGATGFGILLETGRSLIWIALCF